MKTLGVLVIMALVVGAFTSIPNVSAIGVYGGADFTKAQGTTHLTFGSASGKVCGIELCGSKSMPAIKETPVEIITGNGDAKSEALNRALQGQEASVIIREYNEFKGITIVENINSTEEIVSDFNAFANPDFLNSKTTSTVMGVQDEMTIEEKKQAQVDAVKANFPGYIRESYANADHPIYVKPIIEVKDDVSTLVPDNIKETLDEYCALSPEGQAEMIEKNDYSKHEDRIAEALKYCSLDEEGQKAMIESYKTEYTHDEVVVYDDEQADLILLGMGFDIDMSKIGACGPGTELIDGICFITHTDTGDWADSWDTKEDKEIVLEQIVMTNGTEAIPLVDDTMQVPAPGFEDVEEMVVEEVVEPIVVEEVKQEIILETMTIVVDGKTFKDQASADRYLALTGKTIAPVVEPVIEPIIEAIPAPVGGGGGGSSEETNPRLDTTNSTESIPEPSTDETSPPPFQP